MAPSDIHVEPSLDDRYLDFINQSAAVFQNYPQLEVSRYFIFRDLLIQRKTRTAGAIARHWLRPMIHPMGEVKPIPHGDVLLLVEGSREVIGDALLPIYDELQSRGVTVRLLAAGRTGSLPNSAYEFQAPTHVLAPRWASRAWDELCGKFGALRCPSLRRAFKDFCCGVQDVYDGLNRVLDSAKPKVVVLASTQLPVGAGLVAAARQRGILTLLLQHGVLQPLYLPLIADRLLTWGESSTETCLKLGVSSSKLITVGSPRHDAMQRPIDESSKRRLLEALGLQQKPTLVFFSNGNDLLRNGLAPAQCAAWLEATASRYAGDVNFVIRLHPNEDGSLYRQSTRLRVTKDIPDLKLSLAGCDWASSICSTVLYDALLFAKPVWQFHADNWPELADNWRQGLATRISSHRELNNQIEQILKSGLTPVDPSLSRRVFANQGRSVDAIADYVMQQLAPGTRDAQPTMQ